MRSVYVTFEETNLVPGAYTPLTWRADVTYRDIENWTVVGIELPVDYHLKDWMPVPQGTALYRMLMDRSTDPDGWDAIESVILADMAEPEDMSLEPLSDYALAAE